MFVAGFDDADVNKVFQEAVQISESIEDTGQRSYVLKEIASAMAESEYYRRALDIARTIEDERDKSRALEEIAFKARKAGLSDTEIDRLFKKAKVERP